MKEWSSNDYADFWYYQIGVNAIPYNGIQKQTWVKWKNHPKGNFQTESIPLEVFEAWKKNNSFSKGIAVVCSQVFRGEHIGKWLNGIDLDNKIAIDVLFPNISLEDCAKTTFIEQHANTEKCHIYYYTKRPITSKVANSDREEGEDKPTKPQIEIKSNGSAIINCTPSPHKDGSNLRILGTIKIKTIDADKLEEKIDNMCREHKIPYLEKNNDIKLQSTYHIQSVQSIINSDRKMYPGENRQFALLRYLDSKKIKNPEIGKEVLLSLADEFMDEHFVEKYPQNKVQQIIKDAYKYGTKILVEKKQKDENEKKTLEEKAITLDQLNNITNPKYADKLIRVKAIISSNLIPYAIPYKIEAECVNYTDKHTIHDKDSNHPVKTEIILSEKDFPKFIDVSSNIRDKILQNLTRFLFQKGCTIRVTELESITINKMKIRPIMHNLITDGKKFFDDKGNKYNSYDIYIIQKGVDDNLTAGKEIEIVGYVIADPKNSKITIMASTLKELDENKFDLEKIKALQEFHKDKNTNQIINWYTQEFSKFSKIIKRENIAIGVILCMFSSLGFEFEDEVVRGWVNTTIIGDSTTAKSKTVKETIKLLGVGQIASGEMASIAGIAGASVQTSGGQWFTDYGLLPLQDKKALWLDGAHKIPKNEMDRLAEAERNGKIEINKASKGEAWARTRQGKIMNPINDDRRDTTTMNNFIYPVQALSNLFQLQSIARIDMAIIVSDDVNAKYRNKKMIEKNNPLLEHYSELIKLIWSNQCNIIFEDGVIENILDQATILEDEFKIDEMPLVTNDQKYKLAKLAISVAGFTCSFNKEYTQIIVKKEHVDYIMNFITQEYRKIGLDSIKKQDTFGEINIKLLYEIVEKINQKTNRDIETVVKMIKWIGTHRKFTKDDIMEEYSLTRDNQTSPLLAYLINEQIIKRQNNGFAVTKKAIVLTKFIINKGKKIHKELKDVQDDLIKNFYCSGCNTEWKSTRDTKEFIQKDHSCILDGTITESET